MMQEHQKLLIIQTENMDMSESNKLLCCRRCGHEELKFVKDDDSDKVWILYIQCTHCEHKLMGIGKTYDEARKRVIEAWNSDGLNEY